MAFRQYKNSTGSIGQMMFFLYDVYGILYSDNFTFEGKELCYYGKVGEILESEDGYPLFKFTDDMFLWANKIQEKKRHLAIKACEDDDFHNY